MKRYLISFLLLICTSLQAAELPAFYGDLKKVSFDNVTISYYRFGQGKPLVMIPGHGDNMMTWHPQLLQSLSKNREVIIFDFPGVGQSTIDGAFPDQMQQFSDIVYQFVQTQKLKKPDLLGFSMGGSVLLFLATQHGDQYGNLIVVGGKAGGKQTVLPDPKLFKMLDSPDATAEDMAKALLFPPSAADKAVAYAKIYMSLPQEKMDPKATQAQATAVSRENNGEGVWKKLPDIKNNVMIINGTEDVLTPIKNAVMIADAIPAAWLIQVKGAGHGVLFQEPEYFAKLIELFINY